MQSMTTLSFAEVVRTLGDLDPDLMICARDRRPLSQDSEVVLINETQGEAIPPGFTYLLEISLAVEALDVWSEWRSRRTPTISEAVAAITWYGDHDAYQPVDA